MYNKVVIMGRICNDLELKTTPSGVSVLPFTVAVDRRYQPDKENKTADFFNCVAWREEAEFISRFWTKGRAILVEGELQNRKYTDKSGVERWITEIVVDRVCFTGDKKPEGRERPPLPEEPPTHKKQETADAPAPEQQQMTAESFAAATADDYPF